jgi:hypothetical protein
MGSLEFATVGSSSRLKRQQSPNSDSESEEDDLCSLEDFAVETNYVIQQEEEFGSVYISFCL